MSDVVLYEQSGAIVTLTLNKHETRNAISEDVMVNAIVAACEALHCRVKFEQTVPCGLADWVVVNESVHDFFFTG